MIDGDRYQKLIERARVENEAARVKARAGYEAAAVARAELDRLVAERDDLSKKLADFEAGKPGDPLTAEEFAEASFRVRWLAGAVTAQKRIAQTAEAEAGTYGRGLNDVHNRARAGLEELIAADVAALQTGKRAELEAALK